MKTQTLTAKIIEYLNQNPNLTSVEIAQRIGCKPSTVSAIVRRYLSRGVLSREKDASGMYRYRVTDYQKFLSTQKKPPMISTEKVYEVVKQNPGLCLYDITRKFVGIKNIKSASGTVYAALKRLIKQGKVVKKGLAYFPAQIPEPQIRIPEPQISDHISQALEIIRQNPGITAVEIAERISPTERESLRSKLSRELKLLAQFGHVVRKVEDGSIRYYPAEAPKQVPVTQPTPSPQPAPPPTFPTKLDLGVLGVFEVVVEDGVAKLKNIALEQVEQLCQRVAQMNAQIEEFRAVCQRWEQLTKQYQDTVNELTSKLNESLQRIEQQQNEIQSLRAELEKEKREKERLMEAAGEDVTKIMQLQEWIKQLQQELKEKQLKIEEYERKKSIWQRLGLR